MIFWIFFLHSKFLVYTIKSYNYSCCIICIFPWRSILVDDIVASIFICPTMFFFFSFILKIKIVLILSMYITTCEWNIICLNVDVLSLSTFFNRIVTLSMDLFSKSFFFHFCTLGSNCSLNSTHSVVRWNENKWKYDARNR